MPANTEPSDIAADIVTDTESPKLSRRERRARKKGKGSGSPPDPGAPPPPFAPPTSSAPRGPDRSFNRASRHRGSGGRR